jgi:HAE1 family hydrophobic/amphiphilic exporter-1
MFGFTEAGQDISFEEMKRHQQAVADVIREDPNVDSFSSSIGASGPNATGNTGRIFARLKPRSERKLSPDGLRVTSQTGEDSRHPRLLAEPPPIRIGGQLTKSLYQFTLQIGYR